jgi:dTMP kinase
VLATIAGMDDARAWALRTGTALRCREALDSMIGLDQEAAWEIREACLEIWPPSVVKSLGVLVSGARGHDLVERALAGFADQISLLKQAAIIATGANLMRSVMAA